MGTRSSLFRLFSGQAVWMGVLSLAGSAALGPTVRVQSRAEIEGFVGSKRCAECHRDIASVQLDSDHARTLRKTEALDELLKKAPVKFTNENNGVQYQLQRSTRPNGKLDLTASKDGRTDKLQLIWGFGTGRKGITFIGRTEEGNFGQSRVSWYQRNGVLDLTPGLDTVVKDSFDALAEWQTPSQTERCFSCHVTRQPDTRPDQITDEISGVQCERCHGPGRRHVEAVTHRANEPGAAILNHRKMDQRALIRFCGACHGEPPEESDLSAFSQIVLDPRSIRFPAKRLLLSRCYDESKGQLTCLTCHDPHDNLPKSLSHFDKKCQTCHSSKSLTNSVCPVAEADCASCHMPRDQVVGHLDFVDHWIRKVGKK